MVLAVNFAKDILKKTKLQGNNLKGQVYKAHSNSYYVMSDGKLNKCGARGLLKIKSDGICVGDYVEFDKGVITNIYPRKNRFIRPSVSNIDVIVAVISPEPKPDLLLVDKLLISAEKENVDRVVVVNKTDVNDNLIDDIKNEYKNLSLDVLCVSAKTGEGIEELKKRIENKVAVLAGQSAVGKTSIINSIFGLELKTGELSEKILRGKHTTTRSEIFEYSDYKIIDSPGFAVIEADVSLDVLPECYPEYFEVSCGCKFRGCSHVNEPDCKVKEMVNKGVFSSNRYKRYLEIYEEISKRRD